MVTTFRVRKITAKLPLPIFRESDLPDMENIQRHAPEIETGVEKEEETEHHLQAALSAHQVAVRTGAKIESHIPVPDASFTIDKNEYEQLYNKTHKETSALIRYSCTVEDVIGCPYFMDEEDERFLKALNVDLSEDDFEKIMNEFEHLTKNSLILTPQSLDLPDFTHFMESSVPSNSILHAFTCLEPIYDHWKQRKLAVNKNHLIPQLKTDDTIKNSQYDPYVCFRRREIKSGRKTRLTDQRSLEKLRRLRHDMETARTLLQMVVRREEMKKEDMIVDHKVFDKKCQVLEYQKLLGIQEDLSSLLPKKKVKLPSTGSTPSAIIKIPVGKLKADYPIQIPVEKSVEQLAIESELNKRKVIEEQYDTIDYEPLLPALQSQFYQALSNQNPIRYRKRIGRGGRLFIDRVGYRHVSSPSTFDKYRFDQSDEEEDDDPMEVDEMDDRYLRHRAQLLSDAKLGYFVTNHLSRPATQIPNTVEASAQRLSLATGAFGFKKQSKKRTPDETALAMANDMIAANVAAAMKGGSPAARLDMNPQNNGMVH